MNAHVVSISGGFLLGCTEFCAKDIVEESHAYLHGIAGSIPRLNTLYYTFYNEDGIIDG